MEENAPVIPTFDELTEELEKRLEPIEASRQRYQSLNILLAVLYAGILAGVIFYFFSWILLIAVACLLAMWFYKEKNRQKMFVPVGSDTIEEYKQQVVRLFVKHLVNRGEFFSHKGISQDHVRESRLFTYANMYHSEDMITGVSMGQEFCFSEVWLQDKYTYTRKGEKKEAVKTIFRGLFYMTEFPELLSTDIQICTPKWPKNYGGIMTVEDWEFKQRFKVYTTDEEAATSFFTETRIKQIIALHDSFGKKEIGISFINSKLFVSINCKEDMFDVKPFQSVYKRVKLEEEFNIIRAFTNVLPVLK